MFVKIYSPSVVSDDENQGPAVTLYECRKVQIQPHEDRLFVTLDNERDFEVDKTIQDLYVMNEAGQTIDSFRQASGPPTVVYK